MHHPDAPQTATSVLAAEVDAVEADAIEAEAFEADVLETAEQVEDVEGISEEGGYEAEKTEAVEAKDSDEDADDDITAEVEEDGEVTDKSLVLNVSTAYPENASFDETTQLGDSIFNIIVATAGKVTVDGNTKSIDDFSFTRRLKLGGKGKTTDLAVSFTAEKAGNLTVYAMSSSSGDDRTLLLTPDGTVETAKLVNDGGSIAKLSAPVESGTYYLYGVEGAFNIYYLALEYTDTEAPPEEPTSLEDAEIKYTVNGSEASSATYTGEPVDLDVNVTVEGELVDPKYYEVSYLREGDSENWDESDDLTSAGEIKAKITAVEEYSDYYTDEKESDNVFTIEKANLTAPGAEKTTEKLDLAGEYDEELTFDVAGLFADVPDAANLKYTYDEEGSELADIIEEESVSVEEGILKYSIVDDPSSATEKTAELKVKVSSDNYNELTVTITVEMMEKTAVTVTIELPEKTYDGVAYNANEEAKITVTDPSEDTETIKADLQENLVFTFTVNGDEDGTETTPINAGEYDVAVTLNDNSDYKLASEIEDLTLTINPKELTITPKNKNWYAGSAPLEAGEAKSSDYTHTEMVEGDSIETQPTLKYCQTGTETELTEENWAALAAGDTVDIVASGADAGSNYDIKYEKGTLTVIESTPLAPNEHELDLTRDWHLNEEGTAFVNNTEDDYFTVAGSPKTAGEGNSYPLITYGNYTNVLKMNSSGKVTFNAPKDSTLEIIVHIPADKTSSVSVDGTVVATSSTDDLTVSAADGVKLTRLGDGEIVPPYSETAPTNNSAIHKIELTLSADGEHTIARGSNEFQLYYAKVTEPDGDIDPPVAETVDVNFTISDSDNKLGDAKIYLTAGEEEIEVTGSPITLKVGTVYTLVIRGSDNENLTAKIDGSNTYTAKAGETEVTITVSDSSENPNPPTPGEVTAPTASPSSGNKVKLGGSVTLLAPSADEIRYTIGLNGVVPTEPTVSTGTPYSSPIQLTETGVATIKAIAVKDGKASSVAEFNYTVYESSNAGLEIILNQTSYTYSGSAIIPDYSVTYDGDDLIEGIDYTVKLSNNVKVADNKAKITVTGKGNLSGSTSATFNITQADIADVDSGDIIVAENAKASIVLGYNGIKLTAKDFDYKDAGDKSKKWSEDGTIEITGKGNFTGELTLNVKVISKEAQKNAKIVVDISDSTNKNLIYTGAPVYPVIKVTNKAGDELGEDEYIISYPNNVTDAGTKKFTVIGKSERCMGTVSKSYTIKPALKTGTVEVTVGGIEPEKLELPFVSTGVTFDQDELEVTYEGMSESLKLGTDYKITYSANKKVGTAKYTVTGQGNYKGVKKTGTFTIAAAKLDGEGIKVIVSDKLYTKANAFKSTPVVIETATDTVLKSSNYKVTYCSDEDGTVLKSVEPDQTVYVKIEGKGGYAGSTVTESYTVKAGEGSKDLSTAKIKVFDKSGKTAKFYHIGEGEEVKPDKIVITYKDKTVDTLTLGENDEYTCDNTDANYTVNFVSNINKGKATVIIEADGTYAVGGKTATFNIAARNLKEYLGW